MKLVLIDFCHKNHRIVDYYMVDETQYLSKEKYDELKKELDYLKTKRRKEIADLLEYAKSLGDLSENAEYHEARDMQASVEERIIKVESILQTASIVSHPKKSDVISVGSTVVVQKEGSKETCTYHIVGSEESNTAEGKISNRSPLGEAMMGKKKGETFSFKAPKGAVNYKVLSVE